MKECFVVRFLCAWLLLGSAQITRAQTFTPAVERLENDRFLFQLQSQRLAAWGRLERAGQGLPVASPNAAVDRERDGFFEAVRLSHWKEAGERCLTALTLPPAASNAFVLDETWELGCAEIMARGTAPSLHRDAKIAEKVWRGFFGSPLLVNAGTRTRRKIFEALVLRHVQKPQEALGVLNGLEENGPGAVSKALLLVELGRSEESLGFSRLAATWSPDKMDARSAVFLRANAARLLAMRGQYDGAAGFFEEAIESAQKLASGTMTLGHDSVLRLRAELAGVWLRQGKRTQAANALDSLHAQPGWAEMARELPMGKPKEQELEQARLLLRDPASRASGTKRLVALLGESDADTRYLIEKDPQTPLPRLATLTQLATDYGLKNGNEQAAKRAFTLSKNAAGFDKSLTRELVNALKNKGAERAEAKNTLTLSSGLKASLQALDRENLRWKKTLQELDSVSQLTWDVTRGGGPEAAQLHSEIWRRIGALDDDVAHAIAEARLWKPQREAILLLVKLQEAEKFQLHLRARLAAAQLKQRTSSELSALVVGMNEIERTLDTTELDLRAKWIVTTRTLLPRLAHGASSELLKVSFDSLRKLHQRRQRLIAGPSDEQFFSTLNDAWSDAAETLKRLGQRRDDLLRKETLALQRLQADVQGVRAASEVHLRSGVDLSKRLGSEGARMAPQMAGQLSPRVSAFRARVRSALAEADMEILRDLKTQENMRREADLERELWLQSRRDSLLWGLMR